MKRRRAFIVALLLATVVAALLVCWPSSEPAYGGKRLSHWLDDFDGSGSPQEVVAKDAIRQMGTQALPALVDLVGRTDVPFKKTLASWLERRSLVQIQITWAEARRVQAARAIALIGAGAEPVVPDLIRLLAIDEVGKDAASALSGIGPAAIPALTNVLSHPDEQVRAAAVETIGAIAQNGAAAAPLLLRLLDDPSLSVRRSTARAVGQFDGEMKGAIPKLTGMLSIDGLIARDAAFGLAGIGGEGWLPVIAALTNNQRQARIGAIGVLAFYEKKCGLRSSGHSPLSDYRSMQTIFSLTAMRADLAGFAHATVCGGAMAEPGLVLLATNSNPEVARAAGSALRDLEKWRQENPPSSPESPASVRRPPPRNRTSNQAP